jgi:hypothetical protein
LPAFTAAETALKTQSYPRFTKWSLQNANRHRLLFLKLAAAFFITCGVALDLVFILSSASPFLRISCLAIWLPSFTVLFSALSGVCLVLHSKGLRALRPWEQCADGEGKEGDGESVASFQKAGDMEAGRASCESARSPTFSRIDPLRKASLQAFGPRNDDGNEPWARAYAKKSLFRRVFEPTVAAKSSRVRLMRERIVLKAFLFAGACSTVLTVASVFIPSVGLI